MIRMLYSTREKYPVSRVDLTDLFSKRLIPNYDMQIDWHMQKMEAGNCESQVESDKEAYYLGASSRRKGLLGKVMNQYYALWHDCKIWRCVGKSNYDIVQVRDKFFAAIIGLIAAKRHNIPFCFWISFPYPEADLYRIESEGESYPFAYRYFCMMRGYWTRFLLYRCILPFADIIFVQSQRMLEDIEKEGIDAGKMIAIPMGVALDRLQSLPEPKCQPDWAGKKIAIYMGTMVRVRRLDFILESFVQVLAKEKDALLLMVGGESDDVSHLKNIALKLGIADQVVFTGQVRMEEAWSYVLASDVCLSPFRPSPILDSTSPTKIVEYLALGKAVVVNDHPDQSEVIEQSRAGKVTAYDPSDFAEAIVELFQSPVETKVMGKAGRKYIENVRNYDVLAKHLSDIYGQLLCDEEGCL